MKSLPGIHNVLKGAQHDDQSIHVFNYKTPARYLVLLTIFW
jgi:hypothetical protein